MAGREAVRTTVMHQHRLLSEALGMAGSGSCLRGICDP